MYPRAARVEAGERDGETPRQIYLAGESARGGKPGQLRLDWSKVGDDGRPVPLATYHFTRAPLAVELVAEADGSVSARVSTELTGQVMGNWGVELRDFE